MTEPQSCQHRDASAGGQQDSWQPQPGMCFLAEQCPCLSPALVPMCAPKPPDHKAGVLPPLQAQRVPHRERNRWREGGCRGNTWIGAGCAQWGCTRLLVCDGCCGCPRGWGAGARCSAAKPLLCRIVAGREALVTRCQGGPALVSASCSMTLPVLQHLMLVCELRLLDRVQ